MISRIFDEQKRFRKKNIGGKANSYESLILLLPLGFIMFGLCLVFIALSYQVNAPMECVPLDQLPVCSPSTVIIAVMTTTSRYNTLASTANKTWIKVARALGITVIFFGETEDPSLPAVALKQFDEIDYSMRVWKWLYDHYGDTKSWFMKVHDDTFVHPAFLMWNILCMKDPHEDWYIGERGSSFHVRNMNFAGGGAGYILSKSSLELLLYMWWTFKKSIPFFRGEGKCSSTVAEDVTVAKCMNKYNIIHTSHPQFHPDFIHGNFQPWTQFVTYHHVNEEAMMVIAEHSFDHCSYIM